MELYEILGGGFVEISAEEVLMNVLTWLAKITPTLLPFVVESKMETISYNPQRVMRQLGMVS